MLRFVGGALGLAALMLPVGVCAEDNFAICHATFAALFSGKGFASDHVAEGPLIGLPAKPDVARGLAHLYRTAVRDGARRGPNFAGHYTMIEIGCGAATECVAIADARTGKVYFPSQLRTVTSLLVDTGDQDVARLHFRQDSDLLIAFGIRNERSDSAGLTYFRWVSGGLRRVRFVPGAKVCG